MGPVGRGEGKISYSIKERLGVISENKSGWTKELNLIAWNGGSPKYDIREWAPDHERMGKGITFTMQEMDALKKMVETV